MATVETSGDLKSQLGDIAAAPAKEYTLADIERLLSAEFNQYLSAERQRDMAKKDADTASEQARGTRETTMTRVASLSRAHEWSSDDVKDVVGKIIKAYAGNDKRKASSVATFKSEIVLATDRRVRGHVADVFRITREAFEAETAAKAEDKDAPTPIRKAFSRAYHTACAVLKALRDDDTRTFSVTSAADVTAFAIKTTRDRQIDYKAVKKRLAAICAELGNFHDDFPVAGIAACMKFLNAVTEDELKAVRAAATADDDESGPETYAASEQNAAPAPEPAAPMTREELHDQALADLQNDPLNMYAAA